MRIAIATTCMRSASILPSWCARHRAIGVEKFYLFLDDAAELEQHLALGLADVDYLPRNAALEQLWPLQALWPQYGAYTGRQYFARQGLNNSIAISKARAEGFDWLLHIDIDELIWLENHWPSLQALLASHADADAISFVNHEAIPEAWHVEDYFEEVSLFKRNPQQLSARQQAVMHRQFGSQYFLAYVNGKSALNLHGPGVAADGPHIFANCPRYAVARHASLLHYTHCGFNWFYEKYQLLAASETRWLHREESAALPFMGIGRQSVAGARIHEATAVYQQKLLCQGGLPYSLASLQAEGLLFRLENPRLRLL